MSRSKTNVIATRFISRNDISVVCVVILILTTDLSSIYAQSSIKFAGVDTLVDKAIDLVYQKKYFDAIEMCELVIQKYPDNPLKRYRRVSIPILTSEKDVSSDIISYLNQMMGYALVEQKNNIYKI